jgi:hypothetical protein
MSTASRPVDNTTSVDTAQYAKDEEDGIETDSDNDEEVPDESRSRRHNRASRSHAPPRRPMSPYVTFSSRVWNDQDAHLSFAQRSQRISEQWQRMTPAEKQPYIEQYQRMKEAYDSWRSRSAARGPRGPMNAYIAFCQDRRPEMVSRLATSQPGAGMRQVQEALGEAWKRLPEDQKAPYQQQARDYQQQHTEAKSARSEPSDTPSADSHPANTDTDDVHSRLRPRPVQKPSFFSTQYT